MLGMLSCVGSKKGRGSVVGFELRPQMAPKAVATAYTGQVGGDVSGMD